MAMSYATVAKVFSSLAVVAKNEHGGVILRYALGFTCIMWLTIYRNCCYIVWALQSEKKKKGNFPEYYGGRWQKVCFDLINIADIEGCWYASTILSNANVVETLIE